MGRGCYHSTATVRRLGPDVTSSNPEVLACDLGPEGLDCGICTVFGSAPCFFLPPLVSTWPSVPRHRGRCRIWSLSWLTSGGVRPWGSSDRRKWRRLISTPWLENLWCSQMRYPTTRCAVLTEGCCSVVSIHFAMGFIRTVTPRRPPLDVS